MCGRCLRRSRGRHAAGAAGMGRRPGASHLSLFRRRQEQFQRNPDSYNGAVRENYTWSQDYTDLELKVPVPKHVVKGRQVTTGLLWLLRVASFFGHRHRGWPPCLPDAPTSPAMLRGCTWWRAVRGHCCTVRGSFFARCLRGKRYRGRRVVVRPVSRGEGDVPSRDPWALQWHVAAQSWLCGDPPWTGGAHSSRWSPHLRKRE